MPASIRWGLAACFVVYFVAGVLGWWPLAEAEDAFLVVAIVAPSFALGFVLGRSAWWAPAVGAVAFFGVGGDLAEGSTADYWVLAVVIAVLIAVGAVLGAGTRRLVSLLRAAETHAA